MLANMDDSTEKLAKQMAEQQAERILIYENSKYGKFIIQTNEVQFYLIHIILLRSSVPNKKFWTYLEELTLGSLIGCFHVAAKNQPEVILVNQLEKYNKSRNKLAHKMFTDKKLTEEECESSIQVGEKMLANLKRILESQMKSTKIERE